MDDEKKKNDVPPQGVRTSQESAGVPSIVPARPLSLSNEGLLVVLPTSATRELAIVEGSIFKTPEDPCVDVGCPTKGSDEQEREREEDLVVPMDIDRAGARKRKKAVASEDEDNEEVKGPPPKSISAKRRILRDEGETDSVEGSLECITAPTSIIMSSDEDACYVSYVSSAPEDRTDQEEKIEQEVPKRKVGRPKKVRRQALGLKELNIKEMKSDKEDEEVEKYDNMSVAKVGSLAIKWLHEAEIIRNKSKNIKGDLSGQMKRRIRRSQDIIKTIMRRAENKDDAVMIKKRNIELETKLRLKEKDQREKDKEILILQSMVSELREEIVKLKEKVKKLEENKVDTNKSPNIKSRKDIYWNTRFLETSGLESEEDKVLTLKSKLSTRRKSHEEEVHGVRAGTSLKSEGKVNKEERQTKVRKEMDMDYENHKEEEVRQKEEVQHDFPPLPKREPREIKPKIKVLENIQLRPPLSIDKRKIVQDIRKRVEIKKKEDIENKLKDETDTDAWQIVEKKKVKRKDIKKSKENSGKKGIDQNNIKVKGRRRPPRTAAVTIKGRNSDFSYADALKRARSEISLAEIGIENTRIRKTVTGGILIQIPGNDGNKKAEILANKLQSLLEQEARVVLPVIRGELRMIGLDDSITKEEVAEEIAKIGACNIRDVQVGEIRVMRNGLGFIWAQCPLTAATKVAESGKIKLGWSIVRVELLKARPKQCYKCWRFGHLRQSCTSEKDYSGRCYKCGENDHWAKMCKRELKCMICKEDNKEFNHRIGSLACKAEREKKTKTTLDNKEDNNNLKLKDKRKDSEDIQKAIIKEIRKEGTCLEEETLMEIAHD